jgi:Arc/MetJ family transcription regulator
MTAAQRVVRVEARFCEAQEAPGHSTKSAAVVALVRGLGRWSAKRNLTARKRRLGACCRDAGIGARSLSRLDAGAGNS